MEKDDKQTYDLIEVVSRQTRLIEELLIKNSKSEKSAKEYQTRIFLLLSTINEIKSINYMNELKYKDFYKFLKDLFPNDFSSDMDGSRNENNDDNDYNDELSEELSSKYIAEDGKLYESKKMHVLDAAKLVIEKLKNEIDHIKGSGKDSFLD